MPLDLGKNKLLTIIDRTLPEIHYYNKKISRLGMISFCWMLKEVGVDLIEIDGDILKKIRKLPFGVDFIFRLQSEEDVEMLLKHKIKHCIFDRNFFESSELIRRIDVVSISTTLEVSMEEIYELHNLILSGKLEGINNIRITDVSRFNDLAYIRAFIAICKGFNIHTDICPDNHFYFATAIAVDAVLNDISMVTCSFMGYGQKNNYAALEEVLMAVRVIVRSECKLDLKMLPQLGNLITEVTGTVIPDNKPIIGVNIFRYESGIYADGIGKNPANYELFEPSFVGLSRSLAIGKHSGKSSIIRKFNELEIPFNKEDIPKILSKVRKKSISLRRDLNDNEIKKISEEFYESTYSGYDVKGW